MVHLNKNVLSPKQCRILLEQLDVIVGRVTPDKSSLFLQDLLGNEERIMLAKRLAIIILLLENQSLYKIAQKLKVSPATAKKIKDELDADGYKSIVSSLGQNKKEYFKILETLDYILHLGGMLPHYNGLGRYNGVR